MYTVKLTTDNSYQRITKFETWETDNDYFIFYWPDKTFIIIKKIYVISIGNI